MGIYVGAQHAMLLPCFAQSDPELVHLDIMLRNNQRGIDSLNAALASGRNQVTGQPLEPADVELFRRRIEEDTRAAQRLQNRANRLREQLRERPPANNSNATGRSRGENTQRNGAKPNNSRSTQPIESPSGGLRDNQTRPNGSNPPTSSGTRPIRNTTPIGPPESTSGSIRSTRPMNVPAEPVPANGVRPSVLGNVGLGVMGVDLAARGLEVYSGEQTPGEAGSQLVEDYSTGLVTSSLIVGGSSLIGGAIGAVAGFVGGNAPGAVAGGIAGAELGGKVAVGILTIVGAQAAGDRMGESLARYHLQQEAFNQYRQDLVERHPELRNASADELDEITQDAMESDYLANAKPEPPRDTKPVESNLLDGLASQLKDTVASAQGLAEQAVESAQAEIEQQAVDTFNADPLAAAAEAMAVAAQMEGGSASNTSTPPTPPTTDASNLNDLVQQLSQSNARRSVPDELVPFEVDPPFERPDEEIHPPITPPPGGGNESDFLTGSRPPQTGTSTQTQPLFVPPLIDNNPWLVSDDDIRSIRQGVNQTIANRVAGENYRTDAARQEAARLEGLLQVAEERLRREMEKLQRQRQQQINEALVEQQRQRVAAWYRQWYAAQQAYQSHHQQHATPQAGSHGQKATQLIQDAPDR